MYRYRISYGKTVIVYRSLKWQNMQEAGVGAGAEIMDKGGAGAENKSFRLSNTASSMCNIEQLWTFLFY